MQKTKIEWCDITINPVKGLCPMACDYCYARRMYKRFKWNPEIRYDGYSDFDRLTNKPSRVFVGSTMELFGDWINPDWMHMIYAKILSRPQHTFTFLTKQPQNLIKFSPYPDNCWIGVSTNGNDSNSGLEDVFRNIQAKVKFVSIEPLLDYTPMDFRWVDWVIVGRQTPPTKQTEPNIDWITNIIMDARTSHVPIFLKNNLYSILPDDSLYWKLGYENGHFTEAMPRQEFPK